jgi:hypothetical protein
MTATPVFSNPDGSDYPSETPVAWSVQTASAYPGKGTSVFTGTPEHTSTPASVFGWTVQQTGMYAS